jgi:hypothetical protein
LPESGEKRNYIIDGDFMQWPEGTSMASVSSTQYGPALFKWQEGGSETVVTLSRDTDVPTLAESGHQSQYSFKIDCTTAESAVASSEFCTVEYTVTGADFKDLAEGQITLNFWHKHTKTGTYSVLFTNEGQNRSYAAEYTQSVTNTWEEATITITLDTSGTWIFTEAGKGMILWFGVYAGSNYQVAADSWTAGNYFASDNQVNAMDNTANNMMFSQMGLYKGSTAPTFSSPPIATVQDQVDWYVQRYDLDNNAEQVFPVNVFAYNSSTCRAAMLWRREMRIKPSLTSTGSGTFEVRPGSGGIGSTTVNGNLSASYHGPFGGFVHFPVAAGTLTVGHTGHIRRYGSGTSWMMLDSRH